MIITDKMVSFHKMLNLKYKSKFSELSETTVAVGARKFSIYRFNLPVALWLMAKFRNKKALVHKEAKLC